MLTLRHATTADAARLYCWRVDPGTATASLAQEPASFHEHLAWLDAALINEDVVLYTAHDQERSAVVGTCRLDLEPEVAELSLTIDPRHRGRGYAEELINAVLAQEPVRPVLRAQIKKTNLASLRSFWACGFRGGSLSGDILIVRRQWRP